MNKRLIQFVSTIQREYAAFRAILNRYWRLIKVMQLRLKRTDWSALDYSRLNLVLALVVIFENLWLLYWQSLYWLFTIGGENGAGLTVLPLMLSTNFMSLSAWRFVLYAQERKEFRGIIAFGAGWCSLWFFLLAFGYWSKFS